MIDLSHDGQKASAKIRVIWKYAVWGDKSMWGTILCRGGGGEIMCVWGEREREREREGGFYTEINYSRMVKNGFLEINFTI